jgi:uncharacterized membrane protein
MKTAVKIFNTLNFGLTILLILLFAFSSYIQLPDYGLFLGRMHPLVLHLPIGIFIIYTVLYFFNRNADPNSLLTQELLLQFALASGFISAISGFLLASEDPINTASPLVWHKNSGTIFMIGLYCFGLFQGKLTSVVKSGTLLCLLLLLIITGHYGAVMTHGENFLGLNSSPSKNKGTVDSDSSVYVNAIKPVLEAKCFTCHNSDKSNGQLNMEDSLSLFTGGKTGPALIAGNAYNSLIFQRMMLPDYHEEHMPPIGKSQLSPQEAKLIELWINNGANYTKKISEVKSDTLFHESLKAVYENLNTRNYTFKAASPSSVEKLNNAYRKVYPLYSNSPALVVTYLLSSGFSSAGLKELNLIKKQITELNLNKMPVEDQDLNEISGLENLEVLLLNGTKVTTQGLAKLVKNKNLTQLALANTSVDKKIAEIIPLFNKLSKIYLTNTKISPEEIEEMKVKFPKKEFIYEDYSDIVTQLTPPLLENTENIVENGSTASLKHYINGATIKYTLDDSEPDSVNSKTYTEPILVKDYLNIKSKAYKPGWIGSDTKNFLIFTKGLKPQNGKILTKVNDRYKGEGFNTLVNSKSGPVNNLPNPNWLGFKEEPFEALFSFPQPQKLSTLIVSYGLSIPQYVFPPTEIKIFAGDQPDRMKLIKNMKLPVFTYDNKDQVKNDKVILPLENVTYKHYKVFAQNLKALPPWHPGKGTPAWVFIDEIFFYE